MMKFCLHLNSLCVHAQLLKLFLTLAILLTIARQAPRSMGFSKQQCWSGLPFLPPGDLPDPGIEPESPESPAFAGRFFTA